MHRVMRVDGYAPIRDYGAIGDGRVAALVALDGSIDWLCLPEFDSPSVFAAILDADRGGRFSLAPVEPFQVERRYVGDSNVLETTFHTDGGAVRVTDAFTLEAGSLLPWRELARRVEGVAGSVEMRWSVSPRFRFGDVSPTIERSSGVPFAVADGQALALQAFDAGDPEFSADRIEGVFTVQEGDRALLALLAHDERPRAIPRREEIERRLDATVDFWQHVAMGLQYDGPYRDAVVRSTLALRLMTYTPSGALAAAVSCSLPERIGAGRNWDYRFSWLRDTGLAVDALVRLGMTVDAHRATSFLVDATSHTHPRVQPIYSLRGLPRVPNETKDLEGYRGSRPVQVGNSAEGQLQLGNFADFAQAAWRFAEGGHSLDPETGVRLAQIADLICEVWRHDDAGMWELENRPYTQSKMACWVALERVIQLARRDRAPRRNLGRWEAEQQQIRDYVEHRCWSERLQSYTFYAGSDGVDCSILVPLRAGYRAADDPRVLSTIRALERELGEGPLMYRYSGMRSQEGSFVACAFWIVEALARAGRADEARARMEALLELGSDVGLYAEQLDPDSGEFLGNVPQTISHLALLGAAAALGDGGTG